MTVSAVTPLRETRVADGVLKWTNSGDEVALWGVNYHAPFTWDYAGVGLTMGRWLYPGCEDSPHGIRFDWIRPSFDLPKTVLR